MIHFHKSQHFLFDWIIIQHCHKKFLSLVDHTAIVPTNQVSDKQIIGPTEELIERGS